jgi:hypothetical protein
MTRSRMISSIKEGFALNDQFIKCPRDPRLEYYRDICKNVFRKGKARCWCKQCEMIKDESKPEEAVR